MLKPADSGIVVGQQAYTTAQSTNWVCPVGVTSISVVVVGGGGNKGGNGWNGAGGGLGYLNNISVTPGNSYPIVVGYGATTAQYNGATSSFNSPDVVATGGAGGYNAPLGGTYSGTGVLGGTGGQADSATGGGGAAGYAGNGGSSLAGAPAGGGGGGGGTGNLGGGGVGILGQGASGGVGGVGGSGGTSTTDGSGGIYGGGGSDIAKTGGVGAVRIIWPGDVRQFPSTRTADE